MTDIINLKDHVAGAFPALLDLQEKIGRIVRGPDRMAPGFLHNVLYAISKGPLVPSDPDSDIITFANGQQAAYVFLQILEDNDLTIFDDVMRLSEDGESVLSYMNKTRGQSRWQKDDLEKDRRAGFLLT